MDIIKIIDEQYANTSSYGVISVELIEAMCNGDDAFGRKIIEFGFFTVRGAFA